MKIIDDELKLCLNDSTKTFEALEKIIFAINGGDTSEDTLERLEHCLEDFGSCFDDLRILLNELIDME